MNKLSKMFKSYLVRFAFRAAVFIVVLTTYFLDKSQLDFTSAKGQADFFAPIWIFWLILILEMLIQINPNSKVSRGCLKQFGKFYVKSDETYEREELKAAVRKRDKSALKVLAAWVVLNLAFGAAYMAGIIHVEEMVLLSAVYYLSDLICVIFFCPFQEFFMKNKCCVTCRIFAWGQPMITTPMIFIRHFYSWTLFGIALLVALGWEYKYRKYPERFFEKTNMNLRCSNCPDQMCRIKISSKR